MSAFAEGGNRPFVPLRDGTLTRLLSECFGGNATTRMVATVSPAGYNGTETPFAMQRTISLAVCTVEGNCSDRGDS